MVADNLLRVACFIPYSRIPRCQLQKCTFIAAFRYGQVHLFLRPLRKPVFHRFKIIDSRRQKHLRRCGSCFIELLYSDLHNVLFAIVTQLLDICDEFNPIDNSSPTHLKDMDNHTRRSQPHTKRVTIAKCRQRHFLLPMTESFNGPNGITPLGSLFKMFVLCSLSHARSKSIKELMISPFKKHSCVLDGFRISFLTAHISNTRS